MERYSKKILAAIERLHEMNNSGCVPRPGSYLEIAEMLKPAAERLTAYEATGLAPEMAEQCKLALMGKTLAEITEFDGISVNRLKELSKAEADGRLEILPSKARKTGFTLCEEEYQASFPKEEKGVGE